MVDPELKTHLEKIDQKLTSINKGVNNPLWRSFVTGTLSGLGGILGVAVALAILGLILNAVGIIPGLKQQANSWHQTLNNLSKSK